MTGEQGQPMARPFLLVRSADAHKRLLGGEDGDVQPGTPAAWDTEALGHPPTFPTRQVGVPAEAGTPMFSRDEARGRSEDTQ